MGMQVYSKYEKKTSGNAKKKETEIILKRNILQIENKLELLQTEYNKKEIEKSDAISRYARKQRILEEMQAEKNNRTIVNLSNKLMEYVLGYNYKELCRCYNDALIVIQEEINYAKQELNEKTKQLNNL